MFKLGIITDEVTQDFEAAVQFAKKHKLDCVELRSAWEKDPFELTKEDIDEIKRISDLYEMPVYAISSPFYKCSFWDEETRKLHMEGLKRVIEYAKMLNVKMIRSFDFYKDESVTMEDIAMGYKEPIALCEEHGITLLLESEPATNSCGCKGLGSIVEFINNPVVRALYEPGNEVYTPRGVRPFPEGFEYVKNTFAHVHVKDATIENGKVKATAVGNGDVDYLGIIKALIQMDYQGAVILETHYKPNYIMDEALLKHPKGSMFSFMGDIASEECLVALKKIIDKARMS